MSRTVPYTDQEYEGEFNLLYAERDLMCKALIRSKGIIRDAASLVKTTERNFTTQMKLHQLYPFRDEILREKYVQNDKDSLSLLINLKNQNNDSSQSSCR